MAEKLGLESAAKLLDETLHEEIQTDRDLSAMADAEPTEMVLQAAE